MESPKSFITEWLNQIMAILWHKYSTRVGREMERIDDTRKIVETHWARKYLI